MATYTPSQLYGSGSAGENLSGTKTFAFTNPSASSYFTLEANRTPDGFYNSGSAVVSVGTFNVSESMLIGFVTSSNVFSLAIPPGSSSFTFAPTGTVSGSNYRLRGEGQYTLIIS